MKLASALTPRPQDHQPVENILPTPVSPITPSRGQLVSPEMPLARVELNSLRRGVVKITAQTADNTEETGAGIIVGIDETNISILTAYHVIKDAQNIQLVFFDKPHAIFQGRLFPKFAEDLDVAVVTAYLEARRNIPQVLTKYTVGDTSKLTEGAKVTIIGHPLNEDWDVSTNTNTISKLIVSNDNRTFRLTKISLDRGSSGGPIFNEQGALIGMVRELSPNGAIGVKIEDLLPVLKDEWRIPIGWRTE